MPVAEALGLALGGASLALAFESVLATMNHITTARDFTKDYAHFRNCVEIQKWKLIVWERDGQHWRLMNEAIAGGALRVLGGIETQLQELEGVIVVFEGDLKGFGKNRRGSGAVMSLETIGMGSRSTVSIMAPYRVSKASLSKKFRWTTTGKEKANAALEELRKLVEELYHFVPVNDPVGSTIDTPLQTTSQCQSTDSCHCPQIVELAYGEPQCSHALGLNPEGSWEDLETMRNFQGRHDQLVLIKTLQKELDIYRSIAHQRFPRTRTMKMKKGLRPATGRVAKRRGDKRQHQTALVSKTDRIGDHFEEALVRQMADAIHAARLYSNWVALPSAYAGVMGVFFFFDSVILTLQQR
ncbi:hypothetical protein FPQ18DRAFT_404270 [Pyronema domesticum]|nr:hypothetical protein FPQ18DRAFT_404270 [Pyronema domesticum]